MNTITLSYHFTSNQSICWSPVQVCTTFNAAYRAELLWGLCGRIRIQYHTD